MGVVLGVREADLGELAIEISNKADKAYELLSKVDNRMENLNLYFKGSAYNHLKERYSDFRKNYSVVKSNINSYSNDLLRVIEKVKQGDTKIAFLIDDISEDIKSKTSKIEKL